MDTDRSDKTKVDSTGSSEGLVSYLIVILQMSLVGLLFLLGLGWIAFTTDILLNSEMEITNSLEYIPYLIGLMVVIYVLGYINNKINSDS